MGSSFDWLRAKPIAHRGIFDNKQIAENSATAIKQAMDQNFAIELDINISKDHVPVVFHDDKLSRMTNLDGYISMTDANQLTAAKLLGTPDHILTLKEVLTLVDGKAPILLDLKTSNGLNGEKYIYEVLKGYKGEYAVQSCNPYVLEWFKLNAPEVRRGQMASAFKGEKITYAKKRKLKKLKLNNVSEPNFVSYKVEDAKRRRFKKLGNNVPVVLWTIKDKKGLRKAKEYNANFIFDSSTNLDTSLF